MNSSNSQSIDQLLHQWQVVAGFTQPSEGATVHVLGSRRAILEVQYKDASAWERHIHGDEAPELAERRANLAAFKQMAATELGKLYRLE